VTLFSKENLPKEKDRQSSAAKDSRRRRRHCVLERNDWHTPFHLQNNNNN